MSSFLLRFEAIESRIASYSCPQGIPGRVHALRLRRCFQNNGRRQSAAAGELLPVQEHEIRIKPRPGRPDNGKDTVEGAETIGQGREKRRGINEQVPRPQQPARRSLGGSISRTRLKEQFGLGYSPQILGDAFRPRLEDADLIPPAEDEAVLFSALRTGNPQAVFQALSDHAKLEGFGKTSLLLSSIPPTTFSEILRCMDPKHFVGRYTQLHKEMSRVMARRLGLYEVSDRDGYYQFCSAFLADIQRILEARHRRYAATLSDYKYLLRCTRATGHIRAAEWIWASLTANREDYKVSPHKLPAPDAECYNCYLSIKCWHDNMNPLLRFRLRVISDNFGPRSWDTPPYSLKGHAVGGRISSLKGQIAGLFREMVQAGVSGNEETFCLMMAALAREGDMPRVASILQRVWNIDVQRLMSSNESETLSAKSYLPDSPFYPSEMLLYTISHAYGINNQIPTALRLVDFVSSQYSIPISTNVWNELLQWTFVLSNKPKVLKRRGKVIDTGKEINQLPPEAVSNLWKAMISEPYNVKPTIEMYNRLIINLSRQERYGEMQIRMEEARRLLIEDVRRLSHLQALFNATTRRPSPMHLAEQRMRDLLFARLRVRLNRMYVKRWVRRLVYHGSNSLKYSDEWSAQNVPNIVKNWSLFVPSKVKYSIRSGVVSFRSGTEAMNQSRYLRRVQRSEKLEKRRLRVRKFKMFRNKRNGGSRGNSVMGQGEIENGRELDEQGKDSPDEVR